MSMRNVLGVLGDCENELWATFDAAVELAEQEHSRLTLAKTCAGPSTYMWCLPYAFGSFCAPPDPEPAVTAARLLARATEFVPVNVSVTTLMLGPDTGRELHRLLQTGAYDAVVAVGSILHGGRRLRRDLRQLEVRAVPVGPVIAPERRPARPPDRVTGLPA